MVANWVWLKFSPSKFCNGSYISPEDDSGKLQTTGSQGGMILLDYAGAGTVHLLGKETSQLVQFIFA